MALIICPECGKEISDQSKQCIHCGYPISEIVTPHRTDERICVVNGKEIYLHFLLDNIETKEKMNKLVRTIDCNSITAFKIIKEVEETKKIPETLNFETRTQSLKRQEQEKLQRQQQEQANLPKCPYCQSTNLKKITGSDRFISVGLFGLASKKVGKQWHCNNCKSDF